MRPLCRDHLVKLCGILGLIVTNGDDDDRLTRRLRELRDVSAESDFAQLIAGDKKKEFTKSVNKWVAKIKKNAAGPTAAAATLLRSKRTPKPFKAPPPPLVVTKKAKKKSAASRPRAEPLPQEDAMEIDEGGDIIDGDDDAITQEELEKIAADNVQTVINDDRDDDAPYALGLLKFCP
jgi:hypothetical protein